MGWVYPLVWWWLLPLLVVLGVGLYFLHRRSLAGVPGWFAADQYRMHLPTLRQSLRGAALLMAAVALAGPFFRRQLVGGSVVGRQVMFVLDVSASMQVQDVSPSRLEAARACIRQTADQLQGDQLGLVVFTEYGYVQCPLTDDRAAFDLFLEMVSPEQFANAGTNYRAALALAFNQLAAEVNRSQKGLSQAIVLISDGEHFGPAYASVIGRLKQANIPVFPVGVGTERGGRIPEFDERGALLGYLRSNTGELVQSRLEDASLRELASDFNTPYQKLSLDRTPEYLSTLLRSLPPSVIDTREALRALNRYAIFLGLAFVFWTASLFLVPQQRSSTSISTESL